jgi:uncharacterized protein (DUF2147 family)
MRLHVIAAAAALAAAAPAFAAAPAAGLWATPERDGKVRVADCGGGICGYIADGADIRANPDVKDIKNSDEALRTRKLKGAPIFENMTGGPSEWKGKVYNPVDGHTYSGSVTMVDANTLKLKGCAVAFLCKTQTWHRIS